MKALELTEEHKTKLLEMCKIIFPKEIIFEIDQDGYIMFTHPIHWFEFCITYLIDKIFLPNGESRLDGFKKTEYFRIHNNIHLVDYLYEEFLKLK